MSTGRWAAVAAVPLFVAGSFVGCAAVIGGAAGGGAEAADEACATPAAGVTIAAGALPGSVGGYRGDQLDNAAIIINTGQGKGMDVRGQTIAVMVAIGESGLHVIDYGDAAGPDSRGLFQQRDSWGPLSVRMDPAGSAGLFYDALLKVPGWDLMTPTLAAHAVQRNADPYYYARFWNDAAALVTALAGVPVTGVAAGTANSTCTGAAPAPGVPGDGWVNPTVGTLSSGFGWRPATSVSPAELHAGQDIAAPCGTPIVAAHAGTITKAGPSTGFGDAIFEDVGGGVSLWYGHEFPDGIETTVGAQVQAGQEIGRVGSNGQSTGCHDHFEIQVGGTPVDPIPFMAARGVTL